MKLVKRFRFLVLLALAAVVCAQNAGAVPVEWGPSLENRTIDFYNVGSPADRIAEVMCDVYHHWSVGPHADQYVYAYRITNTSDVELSFFSVSISGGSNVESPAHGIDGVQPDHWGIVTSPNGRVEALFTSPIGSGSSSALLWFFSDYGSDDSGRGSLTGMSSDGYVFATGDNLLTPIPEPTAIVLLGMGGLAVLGKRRQPAIK